MNTLDFETPLREGALVRPPRMTTLRSPISRATIAMHAVPCNRVSRSPAGQVVIPGYSTLTPIDGNNSINIDLRNKIYGTNQPPQSSESVGSIARSTYHPVLASRGMKLTPSSRFTPNPRQNPPENIKNFLNQSIESTSTCADSVSNSTKRSALQNSGTVLTKSNFSIVQSGDDTHQQQQPPLRSASVPKGTATPLSAKLTTVKTDQTPSSSTAPSTVVAVLSSRTPTRRSASATMISNNSIEKHVQRMQQSRSPIPARRPPLPSSTNANKNNSNNNNNNNSNNNNKPTSQSKPSARSFASPVKSSSVRSASQARPPTVTTTSRTPQRGSLPLAPKTLTVNPSPIVQKERTMNETNKTITVVTSASPVRRSALLVNTTTRTRSPVASLNTPTSVTTAPVVKVATSAPRRSTFDTSSTIQRQKPLSAPRNVSGTISTYLTASVPRRSSLTSTTTSNNANVVNESNKLGSSLSKPPPRPTNNVNVTAATSGGTTHQILFASTGTSLTSVPALLPLALRSKYTWAVPSSTSVNGIALLGEGAFAVVCGLHKKGTKEPLAVKVVEKKPLLVRNMLPQLQREVEIQMMCRRHPNIVKLIDVGEDSTHAFLVLEFCPFGSVSKLQKKFLNRRLPVEISLFVVFNIIKALDHVHKKGCLFRDLKPDNILIGENYVPKLCDFGWSAPSENFPTNNNNTNNSSGGESVLRCGPRTSVSGTVDFMAPEVLLKQKQSFASDAWCVGVLMYELLMGESPFARSRTQVPDDNVVALARERLASGSALEKMTEDDEGCEDLNQLYPFFFNQHSLHQNVNLKEVVFSNSKSSAQENAKLIKHIQSFIKLCLHPNPLARPAMSELLTHDVFATTTKTTSSVNNPIANCLPHMRPTTTTLTTPKQTSTH